MTQTCTPKWHVNWFSLKLKLAILIILADLSKKVRLRVGRGSAVHRPSNGEGLRDIQHIIEQETRHKVLYLIH